MRMACTLAGVVLSGVVSGVALAQAPMDHLRFQNRQVRSSGAMPRRRTTPEDCGDHAGRSVPVQTDS